MSEQRAYRRVVAKFGTNLLTAGTDRLDLEVMSALVSQTARLMQEDVQVALVTSGAIAAGRKRLNAGSSGRRDVAFRQVLAAAGQSHLMQSYDQLFSWHGLVVAQVLITKRDIDDRERYLTIRNALLTMLALRVVPILNENDVVSLDEVAEAKIGENDRLSALVANLIDADLLVLLTNTDGLYTADPSIHADAKLVERVDRIDSTIESYAGGARSTNSRGGMRTKVEAARLASTSGIDVVIANGHRPNVIVDAVAGRPAGTLFTAQTNGLELRKRWMLSMVSGRGALVADDGARRAVREHGRSLLPAGVVRVEGEFNRGDIVPVVSLIGERIACGIVNYSAAEMRALCGVHSQRIVTVLGHSYGDEAIHRDNLVLM